ncbi:unnamed protein product, partial [Discosporangium mesarthrocarpum]
MPPPPPPSPSPLVCIPSDRSSTEQNIRRFGPSSTDAALQALEKAAATEPSGVPSDVAFLIDLVHGVRSREDRWRQAAVLTGIRSIIL